MRSTAKPWRLLAVTACSLTLVTSATSTVAMSTTPEPSPQEWVLTLAARRAAASGADAKARASFRDEAHIYRRTNGVSSKKAELLALLTAEASSFQASLTRDLPEQFGGLYLDADNGSVVVNWVGNPQEIASLLPANFEARQVDHTEKELADAAEDVTASLQASEVPADVSVDLRRNRVVAEVGLSATASARGALGITSPFASRRSVTPGTDELVEIMPNSMIAKPAANVYGGMTGSGCTWGFSGNLTTAGGSYGGKRG